MAVSVIETIKSRANAGNTAYIVVVKLLCDDYSDLPTQSGLSGYELAQGCIAHVINENKDYMIDSSGNWHVYGGDSWTNVYTKSETDALLDDKQDELTTVQLDAVNSGITAEKLTADETALGEVINGGAAGTKNLFPSFDTKLSGSVTYSYANGTVSASGTKSSGVNYVDIIENRPISELGLHIGDIIKLYNTSDNLRLGVVLGNGTTFDTAITAGNEVKEVTIGTGKTHIYVRTQILSTVTGTINLSSTPMLCRKTLYDVNPDYEPYAPAKTNVEITPALVEIVDGGGKNLLKVEAVGVSNIYGTTYENNGVTYTLNSDGTVSLSGTASAESHTNLRLSSGSVVTIDDFCNGNYVLSGCPSGGRGVFNLRARTADNAYILFDIGSGVTLTNRGAYSGIFISIFVQGGKNCTGLTFSPMICTKVAWDISQKFVPYCPSMEEMYQMILALQ